MVVRLRIIEIEIVYFLHINGWKTQEEVRMEQKCENNTECKTTKYNERCSRTLQGIQVQQDREIIL